MKKIEIFTTVEKPIGRNLLIASENGDHKATIRFEEMYVYGCKRALEEYKKHPLNEEVVTDFSEDDELFPETVADLIEELTEAISKKEEWLEDQKGE